MKSEGRSENDRSQDMFSKNNMVFKLNGCSLETSDSGPVENVIKAFFFFCCISFLLVFMFIRFLLGLRANNENTVEGEHATVDNSREEQCEYESKLTVSERELENNLSQGSNFSVKNGSIDCSTEADEEHLEQGEFSLGDSEATSENTQQCNLDAASRETSMEGNVDFKPFECDSNQIQMSEQASENDQSREIRSGHNVEYERSDGPKAEIKTVKYSIRENLQTSEEGQIFLSSEVTSEENQSLQEEAPLNISDRGSVENSNNVNHKSPEEGEPFNVKEFGEASPEPQLSEIGEVERRIISKMTKKLMKSQVPMHMSLERISGIFETQVSFQIPDGVKMGRKDSKRLGKAVARDLLEEYRGESCVLVNIAQERNGKFQASVERHLKSRLEAFMNRPKNRFGRFFSKWDR